MLFGLFKSSSASLHGPTIIQTTTTTDPATSHVCISCTLYASNDYFSPAITASGKGENEEKYTYLEWFICILCCTPISLASQIAIAFAQSVNEGTSRTWPFLQVYPAQAWAYYASTLFFQEFPTYYSQFFSYYSEKWFIIFFTLVLMYTLMWQKLSLVKLTKISRSTTRIE